MADPRLPLPLPALRPELLKAFKEITDSMDRAIQELGERFRALEVARQAEKRERSDG